MLSSNIKNIILYKYNYNKFNLYHFIPKFILVYGSRIVGGAVLVKILPKTVISSGKFEKNGTKKPVRFSNQFLLKYLIKLRILSLC
ncbi:MAG TPA: hypothetical protein DIT07_00540 [Sphingobacteriaceae bacterium]|nr:hypothetical protein [Sphingobacteriaceae bacterium]